MLINPSCEVTTEEPGVTQQMQKRCETLTQREDAQALTCLLGTKASSKHCMLQHLQHITKALQEGWHLGLYYSC